MVKKKQSKVFMENIGWPLIISLAASVVAFGLDHSLSYSNTTQLRSILISLLSFFLILNIQLVIKVFKKLDSEDVHTKVGEISQSLDDTVTTIASIKDDCTDLKSSFEMKSDIQYIKDHLEQFYSVMLSKSLEDRVNSLKEVVDQKFPLVFDTYFEPFWENIRQASVEKKIEIKELGFQLFYRKILESVQNPSEITIYATSLFHENYFWKHAIEEGSVEEATGYFTRQGGKFKRIFFVWRDDDLDLIKKVHHIQTSIGVETFVVDIEQIKKVVYFFVSSDLQIAWEVTINPSTRKMVQVDIHISEEKNKLFFEMFDNYIKLSQPLDAYIEMRESGER